MSNDARRIRAALADPSHVAALLGLTEGARRRGASLMVRCPAHAERDPSCSLTIGPDATLRAHCFGCGLGGDVFTLIAAAEGLDVRRDFRRVFLRAAELAGIESTSREGSAPTPPPRRAAPAPRLDDARFDALARAVLARGLDADACAYLARRCLHGPAAADGWASLPSLDSVRGVCSREELHASGMVLPSGDDWTHREHVLAIPWRAPDGSVDTIERRRVDGRAGERYVTPHARPPRWPYGIVQLASAPTDAPLAFVEGALDVLAARVLARGPAVPLGLPGVDGWRPAWAEHARGRVALVALDADRAGDACARVVARDLRDAGALDVRRVRPPGGVKDWAAALLAR
jgi:hypothetical protein